MKGDEVTDVAGTLVVYYFASQKENFELDPVVDWEPAEMERIRVMMDWKTREYKQCNVNTFISLFCSCSFQLY